VKREHFLLEIEEERVLETDTSSSWFLVWNLFMFVVGLSDSCIWWWWLIQTTKHGLSVAEAASVMNLIIMMFRFWDSLNLVRSDDWWGNLF
jgi:hypothetical protein